MHADWQNYGEHHTSVPELGKDAKWFYIQLWVITDCCDEILDIIRNDITKENTNYCAAKFYLYQCMHLFLSYTKIT